MKIADYYTQSDVRVIDYFKRPGHSLDTSNRANSNSDHFRTPCVRVLHRRNQLSRVGRFHHLSPPVLCSLLSAVSHILNFGDASHLSNDLLASCGRCSIECAICASLKEVMNLLWEMSTSSLGNAACLAGDMVSLVRDENKSLNFRIRDTISFY